MAASQTINGKAFEWATADRLSSITSASITSCEQPLNSTNVENHSYRHITVAQRTSPSEALGLTGKVPKRTDDF